MKTKLAGLIVILELYTPIIVSAAEEEPATSSDTNNPIAVVLALIVAIFVGRAVYRMLYSGTTIIGTRNGIAYQRGRMLAVPTFAGLAAGGVVYKLVEAFFAWILIVVGIIVVGYMLSKKKKTDTTANEKDKST